jgi:hypothetical protein
VIYLLVPCATVTLLVLHTLKHVAVTVDGASVGLLALLLIVPLAPYIRRLNAGGLEAEIDASDALELQSAAAELPSSPPTDEQSTSDAPPIQDLIARDPPLGLAKLRIDLEREVRRLGMQAGQAQSSNKSLGMLLRELRENETITPEIATLLADVIALANRAVHGEYVRPDVAVTIGNVGLRVLEALRSIQ